MSVSLMNWLARKVHSNRVQAMHAPNYVVELETVLPTSRELTLNDVTITECRMMFDPSQPMWTGEKASAVIDSRDHEILIETIDAAKRRGRRECCLARQRNKARYCLFEVMPRRDNPDRIVVRVWHLYGILGTVLAPNRTLQSLVYLLLSMGAAAVTFLIAVHFHVERDHAASMGLLVALAVISASHALDHARVDLMK